MIIPFSPPDISQAEIDEVCDALRSGWITTGPKTKEFERELSEWCGTSRTVCLNSATAALECALHLLGVGPGDEVITSAYTYTASCSVICHVGATPVLVDTAPDSFEMDYSALADAITPNTKVIIPIDIAGVMCDYDTIFDIVEAKKGLFTAKNDLQRSYGRVIILADAAHSFGATLNGKPSGSVADFSAFSFHAVKNLTTAEGGALTWREHPGVDSDELYHQLMLMSLHGQSKDALSKSKVGGWEYDIIWPAYKCNMTDIAAAIGLAQLKRYPDMLMRRTEMLEAYRVGISSDRARILVHEGEGFSSSKHLCLVNLIGKTEAFRNALIVAMGESGVSTNVHYKPLPMLTAYKNLGFSIEDYPNSYATYTNEVTLPLYTTLTDEEVEYVIDTFNRAYDECERVGV